MPSMRRMLLVRAVCEGGFFCAALRLPWVFFLGAPLLWVMAGAAFVRAAPIEVPHLLGKPNPMQKPTAFSQAFHPPLQTPLHTRFLEAQHQGRQPRTLALPLWFFFQWHRVRFSALNTDQSDLAPVHSLYALQATQRHGFFWGSLLTTSRLLHEVSLGEHAPKLTEAGRTYGYDPLEANTYWLFIDVPSER